MTLGEHHQEDGSSRMIHKDTSFDIWQPKILRAKLLEKIYLDQSQVRMRFAGAELINVVKPGQFITIKTSAAYSPLLRRPFSVHRIDKEQIWFEILFHIIGPGTKILSDLAVSAEVEFIGPLGNYFSGADKYNGAVLVAGGLGIAPLFFLCQELTDKRIPSILFWGNRTKAAFTIIKDFERLGIEINFATDDGSLGFQGTVTELLKTKISAYHNMKMFACGPNAMLNQVKKIAAEINMPCQVSLETMMACGFGVCLGCNVSSHADPNGYKYVCKQGPVFDAGEIEIGD